MAINLHVSSRSRKTQHEAMSKSFTLEPVLETEPSPDSGLSSLGGQENVSQRPTFLNLYGSDISGSLKTQGKSELASNGMRRQTRLG